MEKDLHPVVKTFIFLMSLTSMVFLVWCTVIAFKGGKLPLLPWTMKGDTGEGIGFLFFGDIPIIGGAALVTFAISSLLRLVFPDR